MTWISHAIDCQFFALNPGPHHFTNVIFHTANTVLLFLLLLRLTGAQWRSAVVAALFALHPLHVESVAWVSERKDVLSTFFFMLTLLCYTSYARQTSKSHNSTRWIWYLFALVCFALGLMSKGMLVTVPFVLLLLDYWPLERLSFGKRQTWRDRRTLLIEKVPFFVLTIACSILTVLAQNRAIASLDVVPVNMRIGGALVGYFQYVARMFCPVNLSFLYPLQHPTSEQVTIAAMFLAITTIALVISRRKYLIFGWLFFLGVLVPVSGIMQVGTQATADRYTYIPLIGLFIMVCWAASDIAASSRNRKLVVGLITAALLTACAVKSRAQMQYWRDSETLWAHTIDATQDNAEAMVSYACYLTHSHKYEQANALFERAIRIRPNSAAPRGLYAEALMEQAKPDDAMYHIAYALDHCLQQPFGQEAPLRLDYANILLGKNRIPEGIEQISIVLSKDPNSSAAHYQLGRALGMRGNLEEACSEFQQSLKLDPNNSDTHCQYAMALNALGKTSDAITQLDAALKVAPDNLIALNNLAWLRATHPNAQYRNGAEAVKLATHACNLTSNAEPMVVGTLAAAQAEAGDFSAAVASAQKARELALAHHQTNLASTNALLMQMYQSHQPYREASFK